MNKNQKGQMLLIIIFAITLGLVAVVGVSSRAISSAKRVFVSNAYVKAQSASEAGAEFFLTKSQSDLKTLITTCNPANLYTPAGFGPSIPSDCIVNLTESRAVVGVEELLDGSDLAVNIPKNSVVGINLMQSPTSSFSGDLEICWVSMGYSDMYYFLYYKNGANYEVKKDLYRCDTSFSPWCVEPAGYGTNNTNEATSIFGKSCFSITVPGGAMKAVTLRLMSVVNASDVTISGTDLPSQGYRITSVGEVKSSLNTSLGSDIATRKKVVVEKSYPSFSHPFLDFAVTSLNREITAN